MYTQTSQTFFSGGAIFGQVGGGCVGGGIYCVASTILYIINGVLVPVLFAVAFIVFLYGIARSYIFSRGDAEEVKKGHTLILWGLIAFAVMVSIWGLVNVVANTFGLQGYYAPPTPSSISPYAPGGTIYGQSQPTYVERSRSTPQECEATGGAWNLTNNTCN